MLCSPWSNCRRDPGFPLDAKPRPPRPPLPEDSAQGSPACCRKSSRFPQHGAAQDRSQDSERPQAPGAGPRSLTAAG